jgi:adenylosuccinate synthase
MFIDISSNLIGSSYLPELNLLALSCLILAWNFYSHIDPNIIWILLLVTFLMMLSVIKTLSRYGNTRVSVVLGLYYGDEGKGKVTKSIGELQQFHWFVRPLKYWLLMIKPRVCIRFGGANNAGHTVTYKGENLVTHSVPTGFVNGDIAIIGKGCLVNPEALKEEINMLNEKGITGNIYVDENCQIITSKHIEDDVKSENKLADGTTTVESGANGSTKKGIRFCAADKALRTGKRVCDRLDLFKDIPGFKMVNVQNKLLGLDNLNKYGVEILAEGAQAYGLDPDTGKWPYVTSTGCNLSQLLTTGILLNWIDQDEGIWGVAKFPVSYVGSKDFMLKTKSGKECPDLVAFQKYPSCLERGSTTERWRQISYPNMEDLVSAINHNSIANLVINKMDILENIYNGIFPENKKQDDVEYQFDEKKYPEILSLIVDSAYGELITNDDIYTAVRRSDVVLPMYNTWLIQFATIDQYKIFIEGYLTVKCPTLKKIHYSYSPDKL